MPGRRKKIPCLPLSLCTDAPSPKKIAGVRDSLSLPLPPIFFLRRGASAHRLIMLKAFRTLLNVQNSHWVPTSHWKIRTPDASYEWQLNLKYGWCFVNTLYSWLHVFEIYGWWFANAQCWIIEVEYWTVNASIYSKQQSFKQNFKQIKSLRVIFY